MAILEANFIIMILIITIILLIRFFYLSAITQLIFKVEQTKYYNYTMQLKFDFDFSSFSNILFSTGDRFSQFEKVLIEL